LWRLALAGGGAAPVFGEQVGAHGRPELLRLPVFRPELQVRAHGRPFMAMAVFFSGFPQGKRQEPRFMKTL